MTFYDPSKEGTFKQQHKGDRKEAKKKTIEMRETMWKLETIIRHWLLLNWLYCMPAVFKALYQEVGDIKGKKKGQVTVPLALKKLIIGAKDPCT